MKTFSIAAALIALMLFRASAQVTVELVLNQEEFLPGESLPVTVKITNLSGRQLHLGTEANWLTFSVESADGFVVAKNSDVPLPGAFDLESSQIGKVPVDLAPYFGLTRPGRYKITATLRIKELSAEVSSARKSFDIVSGANLWSQNFGVPATNGVPVMRKFTLEQVSYLHDQMRLYVQLSDAAEAVIFKTTPLGQTVSFSRPEAQVDRYSHLHVLWQSGAQAFNYSVVNPDGLVVRTEIYDYFNTRPRLAVDQNGNVLVIGGVRRPKPGDLPDVRTPAEVPAPATAPAK
ncbi:MAG TPA: hypothetical protein VIK53_15245 [Verrucomicrobiae bacterium]